MLLFFCLTWTLPAQVMPGDASASPTPADLIKLGLEELTTGNPEDARLYFDQLRESPRAPASLRREAIFLGSLAHLWADIRSVGLSRRDALPREPWGNRLLDLETAAIRLRAELPTENWLRAQTLLGDLRVRYQWAELNPSLGAFQAVFDYWGGSTDLNRARTAYLELAGKLAEERDLSMDLQGLLLPILENAAELAHSPSEIQRFQWLWAQSLGRFGQTPAHQIRRGAALRRAISAGLDEPTFYYARALNDYADWAGRFGMFSYGDSGEPLFRPDYAMAADAYRLLLELDAELTTPVQIRQARRHLEWILRQDLSVLVSSNFRPDTNVHFWVEWRNVEAPVVQVFAIDPETVGDGYFEDFANTDLMRVPLLERFDLEATADAPHYPVRQRISLQSELTPGTYLIEARSGNVTGRELLLVSDLATMTHAIGPDVVVYAADPDSGHPVPGVRVDFLVKDRSDGGMSIEQDGTDGDGIARFSKSTGWQGADRLIIASHPERGIAIARQAFFRDGNRADPEWAAHALPEREIFRPGESVRAVLWMAWREAEKWERPSPETGFDYEVLNPRGEPVAVGTVMPSQHPGMPFDFRLPEDTPIGVYRIHIMAAGENGKRLASIPHLFRVEDFRPPEFEVEIRVLPPAGGVFLAGDAMRGEIRVAYYSGGAVENVPIELLIGRRPFVRPGMPWRRDAEGMHSLPSHYQEIARQSIRTDVRGIATFDIPSIDEGEAEWTYHLEARVRDVSRQEVVVRRSFPQLRQSYFARLQVERKLIAPETPAILEVILEDAEGRPVSDRGILRITRERWREIYIHRRRGDEIGAEAFRDLPERSLLVASQSDYYLKEQGFVTEEVEARELYVDFTGRARFDFTPPNTGFYNFNWVSRGVRGQPVIAETSLWVSERATTEIGYRPGGLELIVDRGPYKAGEPVQMLVTTPNPDRSVLISLTGSDWMETFRVPVDGTSQLIQWTPQDGQHPNVFIHASMVADEMLFHDVAEIDVPQLNRILNIDIIPGADGYEPRNEAHFDIKVTDQNGQPVQTQLAFTVADNALYGMAPRVRPNMTSTFYGSRHVDKLQLGGSFQWRPYFRPLADESEEALVVSAALLAERQVPLMDEQSLHSVAPGAYASGSDTLSYYMDTQEADIPPRHFMDMLLRRDYRSTAYWNTQVQTDPQGQASLQFTFPDNITEWKVDAVAVDPNWQVGESTVFTVTRQPLIARLQTPGFLTEKDIFTISGSFQNNSEQAERITVRLTTGEALTLSSPSSLKTDIPPHASRRVEWHGMATKAGEARLQLEAHGQTAKDSVETVMTVLPHGIPEYDNISGRFRGRGVDIRVDLPETENLQVHLQATPSLATELFETIPYLIDYPYQTNEHLVSRFVPALTIRRAARELGYPIDVLDAESFVKLSNVWQDAYPDLETLLQSLHAQSVLQLADAQLADGSWGWLPRGRSDAFVTAYAVYALTLAEDLGLSVGTIRLSAARDWLERSLTESNLSPAHRAWMLHALGSRYRHAGMGRPSRLEARAFLRLMEQRADLAPLTLAHLTLAARYFGFDEDALLLLDNLKARARTVSTQVEGLFESDARPLHMEQVFWGQPQAYFHWSEGAAESSAFALEAFLALRPDDPMVESIVNWLIHNRVGSRWDNTRSTAIAGVVLAGYLHAHGSLYSVDSWSLMINGKVLETGRLSTPQGWSKPLGISIPRHLLHVGQNRIQLDRTDQGIGGWFNLQTNYYAVDASLQAESNELVLSRTAEHLAPVPTLLQGLKEVMRPIGGDQTRMGVGERIEVILRLETSRDLSHILIEDFKPGGFEPVQLLSGGTVALRRIGSSTMPSELSAMTEIRQYKVGFLIDQLPAGVWELRYRLRADSPGRFHVMPARAEALYLPAVRATSDEMLLNVESEPD